MKKCNFLLIYSVFILFSINTVHAQWVKCNDSLESLTQDNYMISACGEKLFAWGEYINGIKFYMSSDYGEHWEKKDFLYPKKISIRNIFQKDNYLLMGTFKSGILRSSDSGNTWVQIPTETTGIKVGEFASLGNKIFVTSGAHILESNDNGETWSIIDNSLAVNVSSICANGNNIYATTYSPYMIIMSSDSGKTWKNIQGSQMEDTKFSYVRANGDDIYASSEMNGFYHSSNKGETWEKRMNGLPLLEKRYCGNFIVNGGNILFDIVSNSNDKYEGLYGSTDRGNTWTMKTSGLGNTTLINFTNNNEYVFISKQYDGIYKAKLSDLFSPSVVEDIEISYYNFHFYASSPRPTPTNDLTRITIVWDNSFDLEDAIAGVYDSYGNSIEGKENMTFTYLSNAMAELTWNCSSLVSGVYFIAVNHNGIMDCVPVVIVR